MSRYTDEELRSMATEVQQAKDRGDFRYMQLLLELSMRTGLDPNECARRIEALAQPVPAGA